MARDRFRKKPPTPFEEWAKDNVDGVRITPISSEAHRVRMFYGTGICTKAQLLKCYMELEQLHASKLATNPQEEGQAEELRKVREALEEGRAEELRKVREALEEIHNLPDDEPEEGQ